MGSDMLNELYEVVVGICDDLYAKRKLITNKAVLEIAVAQGRWTEEYLENNLPEYINDWRLQSLGPSSDPIEVIQKQMQRYEDERKNIINDLREILAKMGRDNA